MVSLVIIPPNNPVIVFIAILAAADVSAATAIGPDINPVVMPAGDVTDSNVGLKKPLYTPANTAGLAIPSCGISGMLGISGSLCDGIQDIAHAASPNVFMACILSNAFHILLCAPVAPT